VRKPPFDHLYKLPVDFQTGKEVSGSAFHARLCLEVPKTGFGPSRSVHAQRLELYRAGRCVNTYPLLSQDQAAWFTAFTASLLDMARIGVQLAPEGTRVRTNCRVVES
jgi:hypothetical protein